MSDENSQLLTQILSAVLGAAIIAFYLFGAYKDGKKELQKTLKNHKIEKPKG